MDLNTTKNLPSSYDEFPLIVVEKVLDHLSLKDILSASLTCKQWHNASNYQKFRKNTKLSLTHVKTSNKTQTNFPTNILLTSMRTYENIVLKKIKIDNDCLPFFQQKGMHIKQLSFDGYGINYNLLLKILNCLPALEKLELSFLWSSHNPNFFKFESDKVPVAFKSLKSLRLHTSFVRFRGEIISNLTGVIPSLEEFTINDFSEKGLKRFDCFNFVNSYRRTLKTLIISKRFADNLFENGSVTIDGLNLKQIDLKTDKVSEAIKFMLTQKNLEDIKLDANITMVHLQSLIQDLMKLSM